MRSPPSRSPNPRSASRARSAHTHALDVTACPSPLAPVLFAPLTGLEVLEAWMEGQTQVVELRLNSNHNNLTIEEVTRCSTRSGGVEASLLPTARLRARARFSLSEL